VAACRRLDRSECAILGSAREETTCSTALAKPDDIRFTDTLPKTRSGKIMRRLLRELATSGNVKGDITTLEDFGVIAKLQEQDEV
jgi:acyl-CoA synthetase (AMP-forming)/AMP-acid ligase II